MHGRQFGDCVTVVNLLTTQTVVPTDAVLQPNAALLSYACGLSQMLNRDGRVCDHYIPGNRDW